MKIDSAVCVHSSLSAWLPVDSLCYCEVHSTRNNPKHPDIVSRRLLKLAGNMCFVMWPFANIYLYLGCRFKNVALFKSTICLYFW